MADFLDDRDRIAAEGRTAQIVYVLYLVAFVIGITFLIGVIVAYVNRADAPAWVQTHYRLQVRTFWIGLLYGFVSAATAVAGIGLLLAVATAVWIIVRCVIGLKYIARGEPYPNPESWIW